MNNSEYYMICIESIALILFFFFSYKILGVWSKANIIKLYRSKFYPLCANLKKSIYFIILKKKLKQKWNPIFKKNSYIYKRARWEKTKRISLHKLKKFEGFEKKHYKRHQKKREKNKNILF